MLDALDRPAARPTSRRSPAPSSSSPRSTRAPSPPSSSRAAGRVASLSDHITVAGRDGGTTTRRRPSFAIARTGTDVSVRFAGIPLGHEFTSFVLALLQVGGHPSTASDDVIEQIRALDGDYHFETYFSLSCQNCPDVVQALNLMSVLNPKISHTAIDGALFQDEVEARKVMAVPTVFLNGEPFDQGRMTSSRSSPSSTRRRPTGRRGDRRQGPVRRPRRRRRPGRRRGAVYAARKGIRTGVVAERFGGQVLDTMAIENFISVPYTEGPKLARALEQHVAEYDVDVMDLQRPGWCRRRARRPDDRRARERRLAAGASVVLSTGARWRRWACPARPSTATRA